MAAACLPKRGITEAQVEEAQIDHQQATDKMTYRPSPTKRYWTGRARALGETTRSTGRARVYSQLNRPLNVQYIVRNFLHDSVRRSKVRY
jgi:hypothetical protein